MNYGKITLVDENEGVISDDCKISNTFSEYFENATKKSDLNNSYSLNNIEPTSIDPLENALNKFNGHPSVLKIQESIVCNIGFSFFEINESEVLEEIEKLDKKKNGTYENISVKAIKEASEICSSSLTNIWNTEILGKCNFETNLKLADVTPVFKKKDRTLVENYRPISVLPTVSKIFERIMQKQINAYIDKYLSDNLCGYRKGYSTQSALILLIERWKKKLDEKGYAGAILMDLSKAFDTIDHELLIAKLHAYGFSSNALQLILSYLSNRFQRVKIDATFSSWTQLLQGVPQGSVLGPLLFNVYLNDLFMFMDDVEISNYADDTTLYACDDKLENVVQKLEYNSEIAISWFEHNFMKLNTDKCKLLISGFKYEQIWVQIGYDKIWENDKVDLLGITIESELKFDKHIENLCSKANRKLTILGRMSKYLSYQKKKILFKSFFESQFKYCNVVWMCHTRQSNNKINMLHERALRLVYNDYLTSFEELLIIDCSVRIHVSNMHSLAIELYKVFKGLTNSNFQELFRRNTNSNNLRNQNDLLIPSIRTVWKGENSIRYFGATLWNSIPDNIKSLPTLTAFKSKIKKWKPQHCPCRLCRCYINGVGFINVTN